MTEKKKKTKKIKPKMGRPSKLPDIDLNQVEILATLGLFDEQMAKFFGVTRATWHNWKKKNKDFFDTIKKGKEKADEMVENSLYHRAIGYSHPEEKIFVNDGNVIRVKTMKHYPPDPASGIIIMKNRKGWRDKHDVNVSSDLQKELDEKLKNLGEGALDKVFQ